MGEERKIEFSEKIMEEYGAPFHKGGSFYCPHCSAFAHQRWGNDLAYRFLNRYQSFEDLDVAFCSHCGLYSLWQEKEIVYPNLKVLTAPSPHEDMPEDVKKTYEEAREVAGISPRAAAALLRVALEELTAHLGEKEGNLYTRIQNLRKKGLPQGVIDSLHIVRIYANEGGSHAGQIDLENKDNEGIVDKLFGLVNFIVEKTISDKKRIDELRRTLPENKRKGIENRDN